MVTHGFPGITRWETYLLPDSFTAILGHHAPWHTKRTKRKGVPWISKDILHAIDLKNRLHKNFRSDPSLYNQNLFKKQHNLVTCSLRRAKPDFFQKLLSKLSHPIVLWSTLSNLKKHTGNCISNAFETTSMQLANDFNNYLIFPFLYYWWRLPGWNVQN